MLLKSFLAQFIITTTELRVLDSNGFYIINNTEINKWFNTNNKKRRFKEIFEIKNFRCICRTQLN